MTDSRASTAPRVLRVDLSALREGAAGPARVERWSSADPALSRIGSWSGPALALAWLAERARAAPDPLAIPFLVAVGEAVRRGLPTAARASVIGRAALTGRIAQGQVGGELARALVRITDLLVVEGRTRLPGAVLVIESGARVALRSFPELAGASPAEVQTRLGEILGPYASLRVGPAGERGVPYANLASGDVPQSFVGRGGLGAAFGAHGLKALAVHLEREARTHEVAEGELVQRLRSSPRLLARSQGGTLELASALAARGALRVHASGAPESSSQELAHAEQLEREGRSLARGRQGCRGCPTPCGWVFESEEGGARGGRFAALHPLGPLLGLASLEAAFTLLDVCDCLGIDAKEAGASLAVLDHARKLGRAAGRPCGGDVRALADELAAILDPAHASGALLAGGAAALAQRMGLAEASLLAAGEAARPDTDLAALLGQCASARGAEPMRSFPFTTSSGASRARLAALVAPLALPRGAEDPRSPLGKGRLVWWHENFAAAVDATGFCAFSAGAVIADGLASLDELAAWIAPWSDERALGASPGRALLAAGAALVTLQLELDERLGALGRRSSGAAEGELARPGMREEYERARGLAAGRLEPALRERLASERLLEWTEARFAGEDCGPSNAAAGAVRHGSSPGPTALGEVVLRGFGPLAEVLGPEARLEVALPASVEAIVRAAAQRWPAAGSLLVNGSVLLPAVHRGGERLAPDELVHAGERLELVTVIAGG